MAQPVTIDDANLRRMCHLVTHDLRNPLAAIVTNLEFARRLISRQAEADEDLVEAISDAATACDVLRTIVSNFDLVATRAPHAAKRLVELGPTVDAVVARCTARAAQAEQTLVNHRLAAPTRVEADRNLLETALENLIANAMQHGPSGSEISITQRIDAEHALIEVVDQGRVIPEEVVEVALGVEGHTLEGRRPGSRYGRGLGLLSARLATELAGGKLEHAALDGKNVMRIRLTSA
ncbi:MAG: HAMP domain-containing sensor histidine kinase [Myxococcota bacterium]